jgi:hypothetical protein
MRLEGLGELGGGGESNDLNGNRTCDLPAFSIVPQNFYFHLLAKLIV